MLLRISNLRVPVLAATFTLTAALTPAAASAGDTVLLGGGAGIVVSGNFCTLATVGKDGAGDLVGFTAASCGGPGADVVAEGSESHGTIGTVVAADDRLDYAVIKFDPTKVFPVANFAGFAINGVGSDPGSGQPVCTQGGATGLGCGVIKFGGPRPDIVAADVPSYQAGDTGAPVTVDGHLVGLTRKGNTAFLGPVPMVRTHITFALFNAILDDVNAKGGPGAGFAPVAG